MVHGSFYHIPKEKGIRTTHNLQLDLKTLSVAIRFLRAKSPEQQAVVDLDTQYSEEYVKGISATGMQSNYGFESQLNACWTHKMTRTEIELICSAGFLVSVIHGMI
nr:hypothetical protein CFP56_43578 [Quercus suber]